MILAPSVGDGYELDGGLRPTRLQLFEYARDNRAASYRCCRKLNSIAGNELVRCVVSRFRLYGMLTAWAMIEGFQ